MLDEAVTAEQIHLTSDGVASVRTGQDASAALGVITLAFSTDPVARWMYPDAGQYLEYFPQFVRAFAGKAVGGGTAYLAPKAAGAALWLGPGVEPEEDPLIGLFWSSTSDGVQKDLFPMFEQMGDLHPKEAHWYLPMIGVETGQQGRGIGSSLMQHALAVCDADGLPAYLESSNPKNVPLYERFGFETTGVIQSGGAPPLIPMYRKAR